MKLWLEKRLAELPRKSPLAEAVGYPLNQWQGLTRFLDDGRIEIDSNTVERSIETCKLHGVNPEAWLADVLTRLVGGWPNRQLAELTPWAWQAARNGFDRVAA